MDITAIVYLIILVSQALIFAMCLYWWIKYGRASSMFMCFTLLSFGIFINYIPMFWARVGYTVLTTESRQLWWWACRPVPIAVASVIILGIFLNRFFNGSHDVKGG